MSDSKIRTQSDELRYLLNGVQSEFADSDRFKEKIEELFGQKEGMICLFDISSKTHLLGSIERDVEIIIRDTNIPSAKILETQASQLFSVFGKKFNKKQSFYAYTTAQESIKKYTKSSRCFR